MNLKHLLHLILLLFLVAGCRTGEIASKQNGGDSRSIETKQVSTTVSASNSVASTKIPAGIELTKELRLQDCIDIALENNPSIAGRRWNVESSLAEKDMASGKLWPSLSLVGGFNHYLDTRPFVFGKRPGNQLTFTDNIFSENLVLSMPLYTFGRLRNEVKAAGFVSQSVKRRLIRAQKELVFNVSNVFYSMLGQKEVIDSLVFSKKTLEEHRKRVQDLLHAGKAARVDLLRTEVRLADIGQKLLREQNVLNIQRSLLASLLGLDEKAGSLKIQGQLKPGNLAVDQKKSLLAAYDNREDYHAANLLVKAQEKKYDAAKSGHWPAVSLQASYGQQWTAGATTGGSNNSEEVGNVGIYAEIPIFAGGQIAARVRREDKRLWAEKETLRGLKLQIQHEVKTAISNIETSEARVVSTQKAVEQAKESLRIEREKYNVGKGAIVDVLDAQSALLESQTSYYRALADYNVSVAQLRLAIGGKK